MAELGARSPPPTDYAHAPLESAHPHLHLPAAHTSTDDDTTGLPPTPPTPRADGSRPPMASRKSSLGTPVHQRSPPTPDASPPRTFDATKAPFRPPMVAHASSRAESFETAREDQLSTSGSESRADTPLADRSNALARHRGLGLAFERDDNNGTTPTSPTSPINPVSRTADKEQHTPERRWDPDLMRNVTIRKKRNLKPSPQKNLSSSIRDSATPSKPTLISPASHRRIASSPVTPHAQSIEAFAQSIGWPTEPATTMAKESANHVDTKRHSASSMGSAVVEAMVIVTPPQTRRRTLRHSGKNLAYRTEGDSPTRSDSTIQAPSNRNSLHSDDVPLHRLVRKTASISDRHKRFSSASSTLDTVRTSSPLSTHQITLAHQESVKNVLQPAADILSRSNLQSHTHALERNHRKRISSAPEAARKTALLTTLGNESPTPSPRRAHPSFRSPLSEQILPPASPTESSPIRSPKVRPRRLERTQRQIDINKSLPNLPAQSTDTLPFETPLQTPLQTPRAERTGNLQDVESEEPSKPLSPQLQRPDQVERSPQREQVSADPNLVARRASVSSPGRPEETQRGSPSSERTPASNHTVVRHSLDRIPTEELPRRSYESRSIHTDDHHRISLDRTTTHEEHALARHLFASATPFSQFSDTPIEVSEATAVSIYPHNNHSLLVVQQVARSSTLPVLGQMEENDRCIAASPEAGASQLASEALKEDFHRVEPPTPTRPTVTVEPSTPPMQLSLPVPGAVESPLKNPRAAPEPPVFKVIPPTPADEVENQLEAAPPGPPERSNSHPQRRLSLVQRARRYSGDLITPLLARATSTRGRHVSDGNAREKPQVPTVSDGDGALHPFWRPRGFWDGFDDSDSDDEPLPRGGDTSDVEDAPPDTEPNPRKKGVLGRRLTNGLKSSGGFLIGNSLGVERSGTNKRRPRIILPSQRAERPASPPTILIQRPTLPMGRSARVEKRGSQASMRLAERSKRESKREAWRSGRKIPGVKLQVQYIGLSGVKERLKERKAEKRRDEIRKSIGSRYYVEDGLKVV